MRYGPPESCLGRRLFRGALRIGCSFGFGNALQMVTDFFCNIDGD